MRSAIRSVKNALYQFSPIELKVRDATNNDPWEVSTHHLEEIARATNDYQEYPQLFAMLWKRLTDVEHVMHVQKALQVVDYLLRHGAERFINDVKRRARDIAQLQKYKHYDQNNQDDAREARVRAKQVYTLLMDDALLAQERGKSASQSSSSSSSRARPTERAERAVRHEVRDEEKWYEEDEQVADDPYEAQPPAVTTSKPSKSSHDVERRQGDKKARDDDERKRSEEDAAAQEAEAEAARKKEKKRLKKEKKAAEERAAAAAAAAAAAQSSSSPSGSNELSPDRFLEQDDATHKHKHKHHHHHVDLLTTAPPPPSANTDLLDLFSSKNEPIFDQAFEAQSNNNNNNNNNDSFEEEQPGEDEAQQQHHHQNHHNQKQSKTQDDVWSLALQTSLANLEDIKDTKPRPAGPTGPSMQELRQKQPLGKKATKGNEKTTIGMHEMFAPAPAYQQPSYMYPGYAPPMLALMPPGMSASAAPAPMAPAQSHMYAPSPYAPYPQQYNPYYPPQPQPQASPYFLQPSQPSKPVQSQGPILFDPVPEAHPTIKAVEPTVYHQQNGRQGARR